MYENLFQMQVGFGDVIYKERMLRIAEYKQRDIDLTLRVQDLTNEDEA